MLRHVAKVISIEVGATSPHSCASTSFVPRAPRASTHQPVFDWCIASSSSSVELQDDTYACSPTDTFEQAAPSVKPIEYFTYENLSTFKNLKIY